MFSSISAFVKSSTVVWASCSCSIITMISSQSRRREILRRVTVYVHEGPRCMCESTIRCEIAPTSSTDHQDLDVDWSA